ncbi:MAG TPA: amino acid adenylation domain-containing protein [Anaerolineae bacterium]|nr:amino acid adenylation domain-containing protein [Anaerolineae bacterium]
MGELEQQLVDLTPEQRRLVELWLRQEQAKAAKTHRANVIPRRWATEPTPLSFAQQRMWFLNRLEPESSAYHLLIAVRLTGRLHLPTLARSLDEIVRRHEVLRTTFPEVEGQSIQVIAPSLTLPLPLIDLSNLPAAESETRVRQLALGEVGRPFDLECGPMLRVCVLRLGVEEHVLVLVLHHIVFDFWSQGVLLRELALVYPAFLTGKSAPLAELPIQYADYAVWQREWLQGQVLDEQLTYWKQQLAGAANLELPSDWPRPPVMSYRGKTLTVQWPEDLSRGLHALCQREGVTLFMLLLAAFGVALHRYTRQTDITVGTPIANRTRAELEELIGFFVNTLVLRLDLSGQPSFRELLRRVRDVCRAAYAHQDLPFERLVDELQVERSLSRSALFQVMLVLQNAPLPEVKLPGLTWQALRMEPETAQFDLSLTFLEGPTGLIGSLSYRTDLFTEGRMKRLVGHLQTVLEAVAGDATQRISELPLLTPDERQQLLVVWNETYRPYRDRGCIHEMFEAQAARTPDAVAVVVEDQHLTYQALNQRANQLAHYLRTLGAGPETLVGICAERSLEMVIGLYAILKAGAAYVPLDPSYPPARLAFMLADAQAPLLLIQDHLLPNLPASQAQIIRLESDWPAIAQHDTADLIASVTDDNLAYVIYTSGSTGQPKGAMNTHGGIRNRLVWMQDAYSLTSADRVLQKTPFSFDVSVWEFFWPLMLGACLVLAQPEGHKDSEYLVRLISEQNITTLHFVPSMLEAFVEQPGVESCIRLKRVICSGEALPWALQQRFFARLGTELHNLYGPTEAAVDVTFWRCEEESQRPIVPIGRPIANTQVYVLDAGMQPAPIGVPGELYIGGAGLARGYHNRPELTAEKFIPNPFWIERRKPNHERRTGDDAEPSSSVLSPSSRLYRTGDLARWLDDGTLEFLGRIDHQVKVRGFRIELGEIETALAQHAAIRQAAVLAREDTPGDKRLVAYLVPQTAPAITVSQLRNDLAATLPAYMIPTVFVFLPALPLTPNGKVDRRALPPPDETRPALEATLVAPRTPAEERLAEVWSQVLGVKQVGIHDNFFELGGDSLLSLRVIAKARQAGYTLALKTFFATPTIAELAAALGQASAVQAPAEQAPLSGPAPLTIDQSWFLGQTEIDPERRRRNIAALLEVIPGLETPLLQQAVEYLMTRHDALRARFSFDGARWQQFILPPGDPPPFARLDLSEAPDAELAREIETRCEQFQLSLDLRSGPTFRVVYFDCGPSRSGRLLLVLHHVVSDAQSRQILLEDLELAYQHLRRGEGIHFPPKTTSIREWATRLHAYANSAAVVQEAPYWLGLPWDQAPPLPLDYPERAGENTIASRRTIRVALDAEETQQLIQRANASQASMHDLLLLAMLEAVAEWTGGEWVELVVVDSGRTIIPDADDLDVSNTVGFLATSRNLVLQRSGMNDPEAALQALGQQLKAVPNRGLGYVLLSYLNDDPEIVRQIRPLRKEQLLFNYLGHFGGMEQSPSSLALGLAPERMGDTDNPTDRHKIQLICTAWTYAGYLFAEWVYSENLHRPAAIEQVVHRFLEMLRYFLVQ